jgi:hypothetical protein
MEDFDDFYDGEDKDTVLQLFLNLEVMGFEELSRKISDLEYDMPVHVEIGHRIFRVTHVPPIAFCIDESIVFGSYTTRVFCDDFCEIEDLMKDKGYELWEIRFKTQEIVFMKLTYSRNTQSIDIFEKDE